MEIIQTDDRRGPGGITPEKSFEILHARIALLELEQITKLF